MNTYIILLRGINVSGKNKILMKTLKELLQSIGYKEVQTYIQSGNIVLRSEEDKHTIRQKIKEMIKNAFAYEISVLVKTPEEWKIILDNNPYKKEDSKQQYFTFLSEPPSASIHITIDSKKDTFKIIGNMVYVLAVGGYGKTKLHNQFFEKKLNQRTTTRNLKTTLKLLEMVG
jgi:uncharacterized protein (DUF1697 family)